jgi:hypothetical protein
MAKIRHMQNGGKRGRHSVDQWDRVRTNHSLGPYEALVTNAHIANDGS